MPGSLRALLAAAALMGAAGVILAAAGAHLAGGGLLNTASLFLLLHACAVLGLTALAPQVQRGGRALLAGGVLLVLGTVVFAADLAVLQLAGFKLFPGAAPIGGSAMILGWLAVLLAALQARN